jgi:rhodanese-related sulfurtransferase
MSDQTEYPLRIEPTELDTWRRAGEAITVLDVREPWELEICRLSGSVDIPLAQLPYRAGELPTEGKLVVLCHHGARSLRAVAWLRENGRVNAINLDGGIDAWARQIESTMGVY